MLLTALVDIFVLLLSRYALNNQFELLPTKKKTGQFDLERTSDGLSGLVVEASV